jgi:hypothetical protein
VGGAARTRRCGVDGQSYSRLMYVLGDKGVLRAKRWPCDFGGGGVRRVDGGEA